MSRTAYNAAGVIAEARALGLDVEAERCDVDLLAIDAVMLARLDRSVRRHTVAYMNDGYPRAIAEQLARKELGL